MRTKRRGLVAVETTISGAALAFLIAVVVPSLDQLKDRSTAGVQASNQIKQLVIAVHNYEPHVYATIDATADALTSDRGIDPRDAAAFDLELAEHAENYHHLIASIDRVAKLAKRRSEQTHLAEMRAAAEQVLDSIETMQRFLDVLALPQDVRDRHPDPQALIDMILSGD